MEECRGDKNGFMYRDPNNNKLIFHGPIKLLMNHHYYSLFIFITPVIILKIQLFQIILLCKNCLDLSTNKILYIYWIRRTTYSIYHFLITSIFEPFYFIKISLIFVSLAFFHFKKPLIFL